VIKSYIRKQIVLIDATIGFERFKRKLDANGNKPEFIDTTQNTGGKS
jgi:hypothetical protein